MTQVSNFIWVGGQPKCPSDFPDGRDLCRALPNISGQFAIHIADREGRHVLARDPLGVNKLFFAIGHDDVVDTSNYLIDLIDRGHKLEDISSVPSGHSLAVDPAQKSLSATKYNKLAFNEDGTGSRTIDDYARDIRERLADVFCRLRTLLTGRPIYVTLSGGLDSSTIAAMAREYLGEFTAVTFSMDEGDDGGEASEDLQFAKLVADKLMVPMETVLATREEIESLLDVALTYGQDWREFNVHCALVNAKIASHLAEHRAWSEAARPVILTGDTMNELMADYAPVVYRDQAFYSLPRLPAGKLRRFLVSGLDTGDREVGIFAHYGMDVIQPYAMLADAYASLPAAYVQNPDAKQRLVKKIIGEKIPAEIYARPKVRAQVGGSKKVGGTLAAMVDAGLTGDRLRQRFAELFNCTTGSTTRLIQAGLYRFSNAYPGRDAGP